MKETLLKMLATKKEQRDALNNSMIESENREERAEIGKTLAALRDEIADLEKLIAEADKPAEGEGDGNTASANNSERGLNVMSTMTMKNGAPAANNNAERENRAKAFADSGRMTIANADVRAVLVSSGKLATPTEVSGINDPVGARVSSIVDLVKIVDASGMGAYKVAYMVSDATAGTQTEGGAYNESDPVFDHVEINPQTESVVSYISKQARKQTPLTYQSKVNESALVALRKRAAKIISDKLIASDLNTKLTGIAFDENFLRKVALTYGGDEGVVGAATLFINKADLITLGDVRGSDKKPVYEITPDAGNPNTGVIKDGGLAVNYCINSNFAIGTTAYGQAKCFELALFSNYEIAVSEDHKITSGLLTIVGDVQLGGDVTVQGGFVVTTAA